MKGKNGVKLADFIREIINTKISEKPVKSRIFEDLEGIRKAPPRLLLSGRPRAVSLPFVPKTAALLTALQPLKSSKSASTSGTIFRVFAQVFMAFSSTSYKFREVACNLSFIYVIIVFAIGQVSITKQFEGDFSKKWTDG